MDITPILFGMKTHKLIILIPIKNGMKHIHRFLENSEKYTNSILFLDDGSTDGTYEFLQIICEDDSYKYIGVKKSNRDYWDPGHNSYDLYEFIKEKELNPEWVLYMDVDETIHETYRMESLLNTGLPDRMYSFYRFSMASETHYRPGGLNIHRLFKYNPTYEIHERGLHTQQWPIQIPRDKFVQSGISILHWNSITFDDRLERYKKFMEIDGDGKYQTYKHLLNASPTEILL
jgi:glycosyltransferase involved in cell wall biosynthesis